MQGIAAHAGSTQASLVDVHEPLAPGAGEVLCRTLELGICGTDREILHSAEPMVPPGESFLVLGHECLGRVEAVGADVVGLSAGDLVVPVVRRALDSSAERPDLLSPGTYKERGIVEEHGFSVPFWLDRPAYLFRVEASLAALAVLTEPLSVSEKGIHEALAITRARLGPTHWTDPPPRVLITGLGPIAFAALLGAHARGWRATIYGRDAADTFRARLAADLGARYFSDADFAPADVESDGYDLILECTGSDELMVRAASALASRGIMVWLGSSRQSRPMPHNVARMMRDGVLRNHVHVGCVNAAPRDFASALAILKRLSVEMPRTVAKLITDRVAPAESLSHYNSRRPQGIKTVLEYS